MVPKEVWPAHDNVEAVLAEETLNVAALQAISAMPELSFSEIWKALVMVLGKVTTKLKVVPPLPEDRGEVPELKGPYVGKTKSALPPVVAALEPSRTVRVQKVTSAICTTVVSWLTAPLHDSVDNAAGVPTKANEIELPVIDASLASLLVT